MIIYVNGCSHSDDIWQQTDEVRNGSFVWSHHLMNNFTEKFKYYRVIGTDLVKRPKIIGEREINTKIESINKIPDDILINDSVSGSGNDRILHTTLQSLSELLKINQIPKLVVVQWSGVSRREHCDVDGKPLFVTPFDNSHLYPKFEPMASIHTIHYIFLLQQFLIKNKINYLFFTYMGLNPLIQNLSVYSYVDIDKIIDFGNETLYNGLIDLFKNMGLVRDNHGHPNEKGAKFISDTIFKNIFFSK